MLSNNQSVASPGRAAQAKMKTPPPAMLPIRRPEFSRLSPSAQAVYAAIESASWPENESDRASLRYARVAQEKLACWVGLTEETVRQRVRELEDKGWLAVSKTGGQVGKAQTYYLLRHHAYRNDRGPAELPAPVWTPEQRELYAAKVRANNAIRREIRSLHEELANLMSASDPQAVARRLECFERIQAAEQRLAVGRREAKTRQKAARRELIKQGQVVEVAPASEQVRGPQEADFFGLSPLGMTPQNLGVHPQENPVSTPKGLGVDPQEAWGPPPRNQGDQPQESGGLAPQNLGPFLSSPVLEPVKSPVSALAAPSGLVGPGLVGGAESPEAIDVEEIIGASDQDEPEVASVVRRWANCNLAVPEALRGGAMQRLKALIEQFGKLALIEAIKGYVAALSMREEEAGEDLMSFFGLDGAAGIAPWSLYKPAWGGDRTQKPAAKRPLPRSGAAMKYGFGGAA